MRRLRVLLAIAVVIGSSSCGSDTKDAPGASSGPTTGAPPSVTSRHPVTSRDTTATHSWVTAVSRRATRVRGDLENIHFSWSELESKDATLAMAIQFDQLMVSNLSPDARSLSRAVGRAGSIAPTDVASEREFLRATNGWIRVAALGHAIRTAAESGGSGTARAIKAFEDAWIANELRWNRSVAALWSSASAAKPPIIDAACAPHAREHC